LFDQPAIHHMSWKLGFICPTVYSLPILKPLGGVLIKNPYEPFIPAASNDGNDGTPNSLLAKAVDAWSQKLLDTTGNNRLIYYRNLKQGTLDLDNCDPSELRKLHEGKEALISKLFKEPIAFYPTSRTPEEETEHLLVHREKVNKKAKTIYNKWRTYKEEKGISILFLAEDFLIWPKDPEKRSEPNAPIFLTELELKPVGSARSDFKIQKVGERSHNETLLNFLDQRFSTNLSNLEVIEQLGKTSQEFVENINRKIPGTHFSVTNSEAIGTFTYLKMPMVNDLKNSLELLKQNDLISAIAGDTAAGERIRVANDDNWPSPSEPNFVPLSDEFLVLDADSSQNYVINAALKNKSLIIEGPPGTGKSQTIANLIACLTARGKSVLFVAEKRAAIDAVSKRLRNVGLDDLVFDLHAKDLKTKDVNQKLLESYNSLKNTTATDLEALHTDLDSKRKALIAHSDALHTKRSPWEKSSFDVNQLLLGRPSGKSIFFDIEATQQLTDKKISDISNVLNSWIQIRRNFSWDSMWAHLEIPNEETASKYVLEVETLLNNYLKNLTAFLSSIEAAFEKDLQELSLNNFQELYGLSASIKGLEETFTSDLWSRDLKGDISNLKRPYLSRDNRVKRKDLRSIEKKKLGKSKRLDLIEDALQVSKAWAGYGFGIPPSAIWNEPALAESLANINSVNSSLKSIWENLDCVAFKEFVNDVSRTDGERHAAFQKCSMSEHKHDLIVLGVEELVEKIEEGSIEEDNAENVFLHSAYSAIKNEIDLRARLINSFDSAAHQRLANEFIALDILHQESTVDRILRLAGERLVNQSNRYPLQKNVFLKETNKRARHKSFRRFQEETSEILTALKPCWMMSPLAVSQSLPAKQIFDFVIFDEASQIRPEEAITSIARGAHTIIAGDRRQLPPSAFFDAADADDEDSEDEAMTEGYESILDVCSALLPLKMLTWHYRSRDERLIALSNVHIYGGALTTFPGNMRDAPISWHPVEFIPNNGEKSFATNSKEVNAVVDLIIEHAEQQPKLDLRPDSIENFDISAIETLGVITFGQKHANAIEDALFKRLKERNDSSLDNWFDPELPEPFFIKNIERVQGDERDRIILSVGYGKKSDGTTPHRFGPVNQQGGERRINVAASRARSKMSIVSSINDTDIRAASTSKGVKLLRNLLIFAKSLGNDNGIEEEPTPLNAFELQVMYELEQIGLEPIPQYGVGGYKIDFVIPDPDDLNRLVLAVEADGASYHSSPTARDRDRLRQQVLEDKGWRFHRIWSTDFFRDPKNEALKVKQTLDRVLNNEEEMFDSQKYLEYTAGQPTAKKNLRRPNLAKGIDIKKHDIRQLAAFVKWLTQDGTNLLDDEEIKEKMKTDLGYASRGRRIEERFNQAIQLSRGKLSSTDLHDLTIVHDKQQTKESSQNHDSSTQPNCACGGHWVRRSGPFGTFHGCSNYFMTGCTNKKQKRLTSKSPPSSPRPKISNFSSQSNSLSEKEACAPMIAAGLHPLEPYPGNSREWWQCECQQCGKKIPMRRETITKRTSKKLGCTSCISR
jgi:very-short-patch-repair endonuclease